MTLRQPTTPTSVVTGASAGIGYETARGLALAGHRVWITGRNRERTLDCAARLRAESGGFVEGLIADFSSLASVRALGAALRECAPQIDVLIHNAGVWHQERRESADGLEDTIAVNHLAPFLLTHLLMPSLQHGGPVRVVFVSSVMHGQVGSMSLDDMDVTETPYQGLAVYGRSKLANVLCANEMARRFRACAPQVVCNSLHPGAVNTRIVRDDRRLSWAIRLAAPFLRTPAEGAATTLYVTTHPSLEVISGAYFSDSRQVPPSVHARDEGMAAALWTWSAQQVGLTPEESARIPAS